MLLLLILLTILISILIIIYYLYFLENYIYIKNNFLIESDIHKLKNELKKIQKNNDFKDEDHKKYILLDSIKHKVIYDIIYENIFLKNKMKKEYNIDLQYPKYPIEYRIYKNNVELIPWHQDKKLMDNYLECIYIIKNSSDSYFQYIKNLMLNKYYQKDNDLIIVKPRDIIHNITEIHKGDKTILKFIINY